MKIAHLADLHLGYRQFTRLTPAGINQREADVAESFRAVVSRLIELRPDLVLIAGDVFHVVRPTNQAIVFAAGEFARLRQALPDTPVIMVAGNHDAPRTSDTGCILRLFERSGVHVVASGAERIALPRLGTDVLAVPDVPGARKDLDTTPRGSGLNIMLLHGEVEGMLREGQPKHGPELSHDELRLPEWDYVALGHYHVHRQVAPRAWYSGSLDYVSSNIWGEVAEQREFAVPGKGFIVFDTESGEVDFHLTPGVREVVDLPVIDAFGLPPAEVDALLAEAATDIDGRIVRQVVGNITRETARALDHKAIRRLQLRAAAYHLDCRKPEGVRVTSGVGAAARRQTLTEMLLERLATQRLPDDVDREALTRLALQYMGEAGDVENDTVVQTEAA